MTVDNFSRPGIVTDLERTDYPKKLNGRELQVAKSAIYNRNIDENFDSALQFSMANLEDGSLFAAGTAPAAGDEQAFSTRKTPFERHINTTNGTVAWSVPAVSADGLELVTDANATDGILGYEVTHGILATNFAAHTVGTSEGAFFECVVKIDDISDVAELWLGWRKAEAYQADPDNYDEMASFNIGKDADGQVEIHTILNNAATAETDTTLADWADGETHTLRVNISKSGVCTFWFDGAEPTVTAGFTFDSGEVVVPFLCLIAETGNPGVSISSWRCGRY